MKRCPETLLVFSETIIRSKSKEKWKKTLAREILKKRIEKGVYHKLLQEMRVNHR